jgi:hypothetical protein
MILRHPRAFADELCRPVRISPDDAKKFRKKSARLAVYSITFCGIAALFFIATITHLNPGQWISMTIGLGIESVILYAFFIFATDMPTFIWSGVEADPNNLAPLHHYAAAPLALSPLLGIGLLGMLLGPFLRLRFLLSANLVFGWLGTVVPVVGIAILIAVLLMIWSWPQILMQRATKCSTWRVLALALYLPIHWILIGSIAIVVGAPLMGMIIDIFR